MAEIKGQLLGILLVVAIFAAVAGGLIKAFDDAAKEVGTAISEVFEDPPTAP